MHRSLTLFFFFFLLQKKKMKVTCPEDQLIVEVAQWDGDGEEENQLIAIATAMSAPEGSRGSLTPTSTFWETERDWETK